MSRFGLTGGLCGALLLLSALAAKSEDLAVTIASGPHLTLNDAIRLALAENQNIKVESYAPAIARANVLAALGQFDPALNFDRNYNRSYSYPSVPQPLTTELVQSNNYSLTLDGTLPTGLNYSVGGSAENQRGLFNKFTDDYSTFAGVNLTQPLLRGFGFGANLVNVRVARANRTISEWQLRQTLITTVTNVIAAYSNLSLAHDELRIARDSHDLAVELLTQNEQRLKAGSSARSDVTASRAEVAEREESILLAQNQVLSIENQLRELIGEKSFPPGQPMLILEIPVVPNVTVDPAKDLQVALVQRPDYQAARLGITIDKANEASARNLVLPQVNLVASYGYNGLDQNFAASRHMVATEDFPSSSIGFAISVPITNAVGRGQARAARLRREQAEADLKRLEADIAVAVANDASQIETSRQRVLADQTARDLANQALADEVKKLSAGEPGSSTLSVIQQQQNLIAADNSLASARAAQVQAAAIYNQALGITLQRNGIALDEIK